MVAIINTSHSVLRILNYNENKVKAGIAECIGQGNYPVDVQEMSFKMKAFRLQKQLELNTNVSRNSVHISLNFDPSEANISKEKLLAIASVYMEKIGFGAQPYLVYQHHDAGHPHIHLVSVKVRSDGSRIDMHNIGKNQSETARRKIESEFGLVVAQGRQVMQSRTPEPLVISKVQYGKTESKKAIQAVLKGALENYKYASLPELNAVLALYNVLADRGSEHSRTFKSNGLVYRILDQSGRPAGVPVKASDFFEKPTLKTLEGKFKANKIKRIPLQSRIKNIIDLELKAAPLSVEGLQKALQKQGIHLAIRKNNEGLIYGLTYVDHKTGAVFNGSALGKAYSAKSVQQRCMQGNPLEPKAQSSTSQNFTGPQLPDVPCQKATRQMDDFPASDPSLLAILTRPETALDYLPYPLKARKKKRKNINNNS